VRPHIAPRVRDKIRAGVIRSAEVIVDLIVDEFDPATVVDVGCGEGWFCKEFRARGVEALGVDGDKLPEVDRVVDLSRKFDLGQFDVALSLEVGEHLPARAADRFVRSLCEAAPVVVFSAAIPKQGGPNHVNEQWPAYWADLFAEHGHTHASGALRWRIWDNPDVECWYRQNLLVFSSRPLALAEDGCPALVHPEMWAIYR